MMVEVICKCGTKFQAKAADIKRGWAKSCSKSCAATLREKKTGNYQRYLALKDQRHECEDGESFSNAHLFDNYEQ